MANDIYQSLRGSSHQSVPAPSYWRKFRCEDWFSLLTVLSCSTHNVVCVCIREVYRLYRIKFYIYITIEAAQCNISVHNSQSEIRINILILDKLDIHDKVWIILVAKLFYLRSIFYILSWFYLALGTNKVYTDYVSSMFYLHFTVHLRHISKVRSI